MDHNATTPVDPEVRAAMAPFDDGEFGNASSSSHAYGWAAQAAVKRARRQVADLLGCAPADVVWTSGATESNNLAILGLARSLRDQGAHFVTQATEHKAVLQVCEAAAEWGVSTTVLPVDDAGRVRLDELEAAIRPNTALVSIMTANNEVGTIQPVRKIAELCKRRGVAFHTDAAQGIGKYPIDVRRTPIDLISISGHKIYGPKGVGALIVRPTNRRFTLKPLQFGGDQEMGLRPGTLNVAGIVGLGAACEIAGRRADEDGRRLSIFRDRLIAAVKSSHARVRINGCESGRLCNNLSLSFPNLDPDDLALDLSGLAYSAGSACNSAASSPSHVLRAMGVPDNVARATVRLSPGRFTTEAEIDSVEAKLLKLLQNAYGSPAAPKSRPL